MIQQIVELGLLHLLEDKLKFRRTNKNSAHAQLVSGTFFAETAAAIASKISSFYQRKE